ncbi:hypothetical protein R1flu_014437 [Riccia fluitans]|uniref:Uncharacterized protein n=1 Tax=Riccia fluitans TaxID=41844 RepID=A0ABD1YGH4_9MARC
MSIPSNDPNVQPLVKGLDADDFSVDKFFGLQDPITPDDVQADPDFEEDLITNERLRFELRVETSRPSRNGLQGLHAFAWSMSQQSSPTFLQRTIQHF